MNTTLTLISFLAFVVSASLFCLMTVDMAEYGRYYWGYLQFGLWFSMGLCTVSFALSTVLLNIRN